MIMLLFKLVIGSSPHTWRIPEWALREEYSNRIISTYVENTTASCLARVVLRDHLHIRGEYQVGDVLQAGVVGSSPHTWRIPDNAETAAFSVGIISTYVENTYVEYLVHAVTWDHLHIRGEYWFGVDVL